MIRWQIALIGLILLAGLLTPVQIALNGRVRDAFASPWSAALINFLVGLFVLTLVVGATRSRSVGVGLSGFAQSPPWMYLGGACGAFVVSVMIIAEQQLGKAVIIGALVLGQQLGSLLLDHYGWLGGRQVPMTAGRVAGVALLVAGVWVLQSQRR
jgi:bacterial/archaeal transporter family-2 protein